jgi:excisionase family DNA binding protein
VLSFLDPSESRESLKVGRAIELGGKVTELAFGDQRIALSEDLGSAVTEVLKLYSSGFRLAITAADVLLTTQEAANYLGISRPTLIKLLREHRIPYSTTTGKHRRIEMRQLLELQELLKAKQQQSKYSEGFTLPWADA